MDSDIRMEGGSLIIEGTWTRLETLDLILDAPSRRSNGAGVRRALVHNQQDGLTVNYDCDYPAGVTIRGETKIDSLITHGETKTDSLAARSVHAGRLQAGQFNLAHSTTSNLVLADENATRMTELEGPGLRIKKSLRVYQDAVFDEPIQTQDVIIQPKVPHGGDGDRPQYRKYSLVERLQELQNENERLQEQVADLVRRVEKLEKR